MTHPSREDDLEQREAQSLANRASKDMKSDTTQVTSVLPDRGVRSVFIVYLKSPPRKAAWRVGDRTTSTAMEEIG